MTFCPLALTFVHTLGGIGSCTRFELLLFLYILLNFFFKCTILYKRISLRHQIDRFNAVMPIAYAYSKKS